MSRQAHSGGLGDRHDFFEKPLQPAPQLVMRDRAQGARRGRLIDDHVPRNPDGHGSIDGAVHPDGDRPIVDWRDLDLPNLRIEISLQGQRVNEGYGRAAMGHPLTSLTWLANWLSARGRGLEAGEIVSTGTCTGHCFCDRGDHVSVDFGPLGVVSAHFA